MTIKTRIRVPHGNPLFPDPPHLSSQEIAQRKRDREIFAQRCREIFRRVYPELVQKHQNWYIYIEPNSGQYFIDSERSPAKKPKRNTQTPF
jgi:hypothetical protein